jgi:IclR family mhp operon transcriptional activator
MRGYQVTSLAAALSAGFNNMPRIIDLARHWAVDLTQRLKWPVAVCTLDGDAVVVRYSTAADSPMSPIQSTIGLRHALAQRALGRAYLAFCPDDEQNMLLRMIANSKDPENFTSSTDDLLQMIATTRARGYAVRGKRAQPLSSRTIAIPLRRADGRVLATFGLTYFRSAVPVSAFETIVSAVQQTGAKIERELVET